MRRILGVLMRRDELVKDDVPDELKNGEEILNPHVSYLGRIAQALELIVARGTQQVVENVVGWVQSTGRPGMLDMIDEEQLLREWVDTAGCSDNIVLSETDIEQNRQTQKTALEMQQQAAMDNDTLEAAGKMAQIQAALGKGGKR